MKHPNKKVEFKNRFKAKCWLKSCFNYWMDMYAGGTQPLTNESLIKALSEINKETSNEL